MPQTHTGAVESHRKGFLNMALRSSVDIETIGSRLIDEVRSNPAVREIWAYVEGERILVFWLLTGPLDLSTERQLYELTTKLYQEFSEAAMRFHIANPKHYEDGDATLAIPTRAERIYPH